MNSTTTTRATVTWAEVEAAGVAVTEQRRTRLLDQLRVEARAMLANGKAHSTAQHHVATALWGHRGSELFPELANDYPRAMSVADRLIRRKSA